MTLSIVAGRLERQPMGKAGEVEGLPSTGGDIWVGNNEIKEAQHYVGIIEYYQAGQI